MACRKGKAGKALKISDRGVSPPAGFHVLAMKRSRDRGVTLRIHEAAKPGPGPIHARNRGQAAIVMNDEPVPNGLAGGHPMGPAQVVKPQQLGLGDTLEIGEAASDLGRILGNRIAAGARPIEADAAVVGTIVIGRVPHSSANRGSTGRDHNDGRSPFGGRGRVAS